MAGDAQDALKLAGLLSAVGIGLWSFLRLVRMKRRREQDQFRLRQGQPVRDFILQCGIATDVEKAKIAVGIREVLAELGNVPPDLICAMDRFDNELRVLPFCQGFDVVEFAERLSQKTGLRLVRQQLELPHPDVPPRTD